MSKNFKILFFYPNEPLVGVASSTFPLLSACLKQDGFTNIKLFDCTIYKSTSDITQDQLRASLGQVKKTDIDNYVKPKNENIYDDFVKTVDEYKPDLIAVTLVDSTINFALTFLERVKDRKIPVVSGGVGSTFLYQKILDKGLADYVCIGEGEKTLVELCNKLYKGEDASNIRNIYLKDKDGNIKKNPLRPLVDLNDLPMPDFSIYDDMRFYRPFMGRVVRTLQTDIDRGCPYDCTYCAAPGLRATFKANDCGSYFRTKTWDRAFEEMRFVIKKYNLDFMWISSETFLAMSDEKFQKFANRWKNEINLPFWCQSRLDTFTDAKTRMLAEIDCQNISVGLEHGSEKIRQKILNKHLSNEKILNAVRLMDKYGIFPTLNNMIGLPDETKEDVFETIRLNKEISTILKGKHNINVFTFIPFSGTKLADLCLKKGYIEDGEACWSFFKDPSMLNMPTLSKEEICGLEKTLLLYIMLPKSYYPDIKIAEKDDEEGKAMFDKLVKIKNDMYK